MTVKYYKDYRKIKSKLRDNEQVLIVDDDRATLALLKKPLIDAGYKLLIAQNGLQALDILYECKPAIIICDWLMPKLNGIELCQAVNSLKDDYFIYFIMLTVQSKKHHLLEAFVAGVDDFLCKPFDTDELLARVGVGVKIGNLCNELNEQVGKVYRLNGELNYLNTKLQKMAVTDSLTGLLNRSQGILKLSELWDTAKRYGHTFSCAMIDIDHFKHVNDVYGHLSGDDVLRQITVVISKSVRNVDFVYRVGGEEFLIIFPNSTAEEADVYAKRCRELVESKCFLSNKQQLSVTVSIGVSEYDNSMTKPYDLLRAADRLLYSAKEQGRNRVVTAAVD